MPQIVSAMRAPRVPMAARVRFVSQERTRRASAMGSAYPATLDSQVRLAAHRPRIVRFSALRDPLDRTEGHASYVLEENTKPHLALAHAPAAAPSIVIP